MALTGATLSAYDEVLKTYFLPGVQDYLNHSTILNDLIEVNEEDISGKDATIECHYGRSTGTGARPDGGTLPTASYQKYKTCTVPMKYLYGRIELSGPTLAATRDDRGAYAQALDSEVQGIINDLKNENNRMMWGCGWGVVARWLSGTSTNCVLQKRYTGNTANGDGFGSTFGGKYLESRGDAYLVLVVSMSGTNGASASYTIGSTDLAVTAITTKGTISDTTASADSGTPAGGAGACAYFVRPGSLGADAVLIAGAGNQRYEPMGIRGLVTDTNLGVICNIGTTAANKGMATVDPLQGLAVGTYPWFKAKVSSHSDGRYQAQRTITLTEIQMMFDMIEEQAGKEYGPSLMLTTRAIRREYYELCRADRRFVNTMTLDGGWKALDYNGVPFTVDNDAIDGEIYFLTLKDIQLYRMSDWSWMERDGAVLSRVSNIDAYEATLFRYHELGIKARNTQGVITDINYSKDANEGYGR